MFRNLNRRHFLKTAAAGIATQGATSASAGVGDPAPEFVGLENWLNSDTLTLSALRGKVVLVDFWTFGCSNCISTLPHLKSWHTEFSADEFVLVGVHTPEYAYERELEGLKDALARYEITYPVAQDNRYKTWLAYEVRYWPTSVLINREGEVLSYHEGSSGLDDFAGKIRAAL